jgi:hypothetical protein
MDAFSFATKRNEHDLRIQADTQYQLGVEHKDGKQRSLDMA